MNRKLNNKKGGISMSQVPMDWIRKCAFQWRQIIFLLQTRITHLYHTLRRSSVFDSCRKTLVEPSGVKKKGGGRATKLLFD